LKDLNNDSSERLVLQEENNPGQYDRLNPWYDEDVTQICKWLGIEDELDLEKFVQLFPSYSPQQASFSTDDRYCEISNEPVWSGKIVEELERTLRIILNNKQKWAEEMEFVMNRMKIKLILIDRVKVSTTKLRYRYQSPYDFQDAKFSSKIAREELLALIEGARIKGISNKA
jgi:hypothetical protein